MQVTKLVLGELCTNCYMLEYNENHCVLVDLGDGAPVVMRHLAQKHMTPTAILLTHGHYDHIAGVESIRKTYDLPVYLHTQDAPMLTDSRVNLGDWLSNQPFQPVQAWETVEDGDTLSFGSLHMTVLHTPGHTPGSVCYQCEDLLFTGDTLFRLSRGRTDFLGGNDLQMIASFRRLANLSGDYRVLPGHNEETTLSFEKVHNPLMRGC
ncbi:MAG: MBL fold metallo-hydrolase [Ruminococcus sp.]|nr:MBL fold metallo-hydrolase [Ruminococcus sp.]